MLRLPAHLPHAGVLAAPALRGGVGQVCHELLDLGMQIAEALPVEMKRVQQLAVHVELRLVPGAVADAHRARVAPAAQVRQLALGEVVLPADPVHDLEGAALHATAGAAGHERDEVLRLVGARADVEGLEGEARVPDPRKAVVPVALASLVLGQGCRGRRDHRAGGLVGESLEHARAELHQLAVRALVVVVRSLPRAPRRNGLGDVVGDRLGRHGVDARRLHRRPPQGEARTLPRRKSEGGAHGRAGDGHRHGGRDGHLGRAAERAAAVLGAPQQWAHEPVLGPRGELEQQLDLPVTRTRQRAAGRAENPCRADARAGPRRSPSHP